MATKVKFSIRQQCIGAILRVLEAAAQRGVVCTLLNQHGLHVTRVLCPRLMAMNLDQPEAQLFFGMLNRTSCSKCKWRKGYSAFRSCTKQNGTAVRRLYWLTQSGGAHASAAKEKLKRWGFNPTRKCLLHTGDIDKLLVRLPGITEVFPCVDFRDRMHGLTMFIHRVLTEILNEFSKKIISGRARLVLDQRLQFICERRGFRVPGTNRSYRMQKSIFSDVGMTATDKVCAIFLLPHVFGPSADILPPHVRQPLLSAIAYAQLILIAVRGHRSYTLEELETIFDRGYKVLFGALQCLLHIDFDTRCRLHASNPAVHKVPKQAKRIDRCVRANTKLHDVLLTLNCMMY